MAFPTGDPLAKVLSDATADVRSLRVYARSLAAALAGTVSANAAVEAALRLGGHRDRCREWAKTPGLDKFAKEQWGRADMEVAAELTAVARACDAAVVAALSMVPATADGYLLKDKLTAAGLSTRPFVPSESARLATAIEAVLRAAG